MVLSFPVSLTQRWSVHGESQVIYNETCIEVDGESEVRHEAITFVGLHLKSTIYLALFVEPLLFLDLDEDLRWFRARGFLSSAVSLLSSARAAKWLSEGDLAFSGDFFVLGGFVAAAVPGVLRIDLGSSWGSTSLSSSCCRCRSLFFEWVGVHCSCHYHSPPWPRATVGVSSFPQSTCWRAHE
jgi:hypothetical protein